VLVNQSNELLQRDVRELREAVFGKGGVTDRLTVVERDIFVIRVGANVTKWVFPLLMGLLGIAVGYFSR
jgi:hypothetical protein